MQQGAEMKTPHEVGYSYRSALTGLRPCRDDKFTWDIQIMDNPNDEDWAAWTVLTRLCLMDVPRYPNDGEFLRSDGIIT